MKKFIRLSYGEVAWILEQLTKHFIIKECREVARFLASKIPHEIEEEEKEEQETT